MRLPALIIALLWATHAAAMPSSSPSLTLHGSEGWLTGIEGAASVGDLNGDGIEDLAVGDYQAGDNDGMVLVYLGVAGAPPSEPDLVLEPVASGGRFGFSMEGVDLNGDGYDDLVVGAPLGTGEVFVYLGSAAGPSEVPDLSLTGGGSDNFGYRVARAGDVDGDGYADLLVGAALGSVSVTRAGTATLFYGGASGVSESDSTVLEGESISSYFGAALAGAGDVNGDGYDDVVVGARNYSAMKGRFYLFPGSASGLSSTPAFTVDGSTYDVRLGYGVNGAGDLNGDGFGDVFVGAYNASSGSSNSAFAYYGSASGLSTAAVTTLTGPTTGGCFGRNAAAGDLNGDGFGDLVVGEPVEADSASTGYAYVYLGSSAGLSATAAVTLSGEEEGERFGAELGGGRGDLDGDGALDVLVFSSLYADVGRVYVFGADATGLATAATRTFDAMDAQIGDAVSGEADINGDGLADLLVGVEPTGDGPGRLRVYFGATSGPSDTPDQELEDDGDGSAFARTLAPAGDVNADGYDDVLVRYSDVEVHLHYGSSSGLSISDYTALHAEASGGDFGSALAAAGDVNGDGYADLAVGDDDYGDGDGRVYLFYGAADGPRWSPTILEASGVLTFGYALAGAGDLNGDGYADLVVGTAQEDDEDLGTTVTPGWAGVYYGSADGLDTELGAELEGEAIGDRMGRALAVPGDLSGDGYDDLAVGATYEGEALGRVYLFEGGPAGLSTTASLTLEGASASDGFGAALAGLGDVDGDGTGDLAVGAPGADDNTGEVTVYLGSSAGLGETPALMLSGDQAGERFGMTLAAAGDVDGDGERELLVGTTYAYGGGRVSLYGGEGEEEEVEPEVDSDGDGFLSAVDCDDADPAVNPDAVEVCDDADLDEDCDGQADGEDALGQQTWALDADGDGFGGEHTVEACDAPVGYVSNSNDCWDMDSTVNPDAVEACDDLGVDEDCDGLVNGEDDDGGCDTGSETGPLGGEGEGEEDTGDDVADGKTARGCSTAPGGGAPLGVLGAILALGARRRRLPLAAAALTLSCAPTAPEQAPPDGLSSKAVAPAPALESSAAWSYASDTEAAIFVHATGLGDVNGDGFADLAVSTLDDSGSGAGERLYLFHGSAAGPASAPDSTWTADAGVWAFGRVAAAGDVNADGFDDVMVGGDEGSPEERDGGSRRICYGSADGLAEDTCENLGDGDADLEVLGPMLGALDVNADGYDDVVVAHARYSSTQGAIYVFHGSSDGLSLAPDALLEGSRSDAAYFGAQLAAPGDLDGDGYDDLVVTCYESSELYVYLGSDSGLSFAHSDLVVLEDSSLSTGAGLQLAGLGDVNGDGYGDLAVSDPYLTSSDTGVAGLVLGSSDGLSGAASLTWTGTTTRGYLGRGLAGPGDVNGDGLADLLISQSGASNVYLYEGSTAGLSTSASTTLTVSARGSFGEEIAAAGDVNGDGYDDALILAPDEGSGKVYLYLGENTTDLDGDGYTSDVDCDDADPAIHPAATELCDDADVDEDCDGLVEDEDGGAGGTTWHPDADGDGYGALDGELVCDPPEGWLEEGTDCDDTNPESHPGATERCDEEGLDEDCDGRVNDDDDAPEGLAPVYEDEDGDGYGDAAAGERCAPLSGQASVDGDCDDADPEVHPDALERCDDADVDEDCDDLADDADTYASGKRYAYTDGDADGYGGARLEAACDLSSGESFEDDDCDDADPEIHPGAEDVPEDDVDQDCDGEDAEEARTVDGKGSDGGCDTSQSPAGLGGLLSALAALIGRSRRRARGGRSGPAVGA